VVFLFILLGIVAIVAYRISTPEERKQFFAKTAATRPRPDYDAFRATLRTRMSLVLVTPAIAVIIAVVFVRMTYGASATGTPEALLAWGASMGTRTTNGEWWRLVTSAFVHAGTLHFLVDLAVLIQLGLILERLVGRLTFAAVYLFGGLFDGLVNLSSRPVGVTISSSGAIFSLYGLLLAALMWQTFHGWRKRRVAQAEEIIAVEDPAAVGEPAAAYGQELFTEHWQEPVASDLTIPPVAMRRLAICGVVFVLYSAFSSHAGAAEFMGLLVGMMFGVVLARRAGEKAPGIRSIAYVMSATAAIAAVSAFVIGNITDVKPELTRVLALEKTTDAEYHAELDALKKGHTTADAVARLAEGTIVSELESADARLKALTNVPPEHQAAVADAREYVRLRCASWRARGMSIRRSYALQPRRPEGAEDTAWRIQLQERFKSDAAARANAEGAERASRDALQRVARFLTEHA
jgi:membrane associated rhomboid family serine protease